MNTEPELVIVTVCGTKLCRDGQPHDNDRWMVLRDADGKEVGASVACSRCGSAAMDRDLLELP